MNNYWKGFKKPFKKKNFILGIFILAVIAVIVGYISYSKNLPETNFQQACINTKCFNIEVANTNEEKALGLSGREFLPENSGMLFPYPEGAIPGFWMKDMNFALDIIWINSGMRISEIVKNIEPCSPDFCPIIFPSEEIIYVLEINSGLSNKYGLNTGDFIQLK